MAYLDTTTGANFIPELWAEPIYKYSEAKLKLRGSVDDYSALVKGAGDTVHIPKIAMDGTETKSVSTAVTFSASGTEGKVSLSIDKHKYLANIFEDMALIQSNSELISKYTRMFGESLARTVEDDLWAELDGFQTTVTLTADDAVANADLESILASLYDLDIDPNQCSMAVNHLILADLLNPANGMGSYFTRADAIPSGGNAAMGAHVTSGAKGLIYGMDVYFSQAISDGGTNRSGAIYVPGACAFAASQDVRVQTQYDVDYLVTKVIADMI